MSRFDSYKIKWQSKRYPDLILYDEEYAEMRAMFTYIKSFRDEMLNIEKWLYANPERTPKTKRGWVKQVRNWMRLADRFAEQKYLNALASGKVKSLKMTPAEAGARLAHMLQRKKHAEPVALGDTLSTFGETHA